MDAIKCFNCGFEYIGKSCPACGSGEVAKTQIKKESSANIADCLKYTVKICCKSGDETSSGAGFVLAGGNVVTNAHVVMDIKSKQLYDNITCMFDDNERTYMLEARIVHIGYDIAILKFNGAMAKKMQSGGGIKLSQTAVTLGQEVYTIGNPLGLGLSVAKGIISGTNRATDYMGLEHVIATDITVNAGNSGGPLLNEQGEAVGILTFSNSAALGGISFGVPASRITQVLNKL